MKDVNSINFILSVTPDPDYQDLTNQVNFGKAFLTVINGKLHIVGGLHTNVAIPIEEYETLSVLVLREGDTDYKEYS